MFLSLWRRLSSIGDDRTSFLGRHSRFATQKVSSFDRGPLWKEAGLSPCPPSLGGKSPLLSLDKAVGGHRPRRPSHSPPPQPLALLCPQPQFWLLEEDKSRAGLLSLLPCLKKPGSCFANSAVARGQRLCQGEPGNLSRDPLQRGGAGGGSKAVETLAAPLWEGRQAGGGGGAASAASQTLRPTRAREGSRPWAPCAGREAGLP